MSPEEPEIEAIGMRVAMEHERARDWLPEDVSAQDMGYDIRSTDLGGGVRYRAIHRGQGAGCHGGGGADPK